MGFAIGVFAGLFIIVTGDLIISFYNITEETRQIASQLMKAIGFIVIFQSANSIITKGVLRGGGDTKCLMIADNIFLWGGINTAWLSRRIVFPPSAVLDIFLP